MRTQPLVSKLAGSPPALHVTVNAATNRIYGYTYDANGNLTNIPNQMTLTYDAENRLATVVPISGGTETSGYTPDNKRVYRQEANGTIVTYVYGVFGERLTAVNGTGQTLGRNVYFGSKLIATQGFSNGVLTAMVDPVGLDRIGSVRTDISAFIYYPYGEEYTAASEDTEKFATYFRDSTTGLDYAQNRYYNSILGRFMTADPSGTSAVDMQNPTSWNMYAYVSGDPVNGNDPSGLSGGCPTGYVAISQDDGDGYSCVPDDYYDLQYWCKNDPAMCQIMADGGAMGGGGPRGGGQVTNLAGVRAALNNAIKQLSQNCFKVLNFSQQILLADAKNETYFDARASGSGNLTVAQVAPNLAPYNLGGNLGTITAGLNALVLNGPDGPGYDVVLGAQFFWTLRRARHITLGRERFWSTSYYIP